MYPGGTRHLPPVDLRRHRASHSEHADASDSADVSDGLLAAEHGRGMGHLTLWCGTYSARGYPDTRFYEPPHETGHNCPLSGWMTGPDILALRTRRPGRRRRPRAGLESRR